MKKPKKKKAKRTKRLSKFKQVCRKWLYIEDDGYIDVCFGVAFANRLDAKPTWIHVVGPPSSGKTEVVQSWDGHESVYLLSNITPKTLISGKIRGKTEKDPSLLPKLDGKILVIKDFTVLLKGRHEDVKQVFGQLRDAYDCWSRNAYGTGTDDPYASKFGIITAVTNVIDRHLNLLSLLGERFLMYRLPLLSESETFARTLMAAENKSMETQEAELREAAHHVLDLEVEPASISEERTKQLVEVAQIVAVARAGVERERQTKEILSAVAPEVPTRIVKQLICLAKGIAMAWERSSVTDKDIRLVTKVALDCIPPTRATLIRCLAEVYPQYADVKAIAQTLRFKEITVGRWLDDLYALGIANRKNTASSGPARYEWKLSPKYGRFFRKTGI
ncbi:hypothetical protein ACFL5Z_13480 [Planctomycetota bacterium]